MSISAEDLLPDEKKQIEDNAAGWVGQPLDTVRPERRSKPGLVRSRREQRDEV